jgi:hypothetical protein
MQKNQSFVVVFSLFVLGVLSVPPAFADSRANSWYRTGYHYSQAGYNKNAFVWMMHAAKAGHSPAQNNIGLSYLHGLGVSKDEKKAFEWFEKAAKQGLSYAQSELAMLYYQQGKKNQAQQWWLTAAKPMRSGLIVSDQFACCPRLCKIMTPPWGLSASLSIKILKISLPFLSVKYSTSPSKTASAI